MYRMSHLCSSHFNAHDVISDKDHISDNVCEYISDNVCEYISDNVCEYISDNMCE